MKKKKKMKKTKKKKMMMMMLLNEQVNMASNKYFNVIYNKCIFNH